MILGLLATGGDRQRTGLQDSSEMQRVPFISVQYCAQLMMRCATLGPEYIRVDVLARTDGSQSQTETTLFLTDQDTEVSAAGGEAPIKITYFQGPLSRLI